MDEPRIIAEGRWQQDEYGEVLYTPEHVRPVLGDEDGPDDPPHPAPGPDREAGGYAIRSDAVWDAARHDYLAGDAAPAVCDRYDLKLGTLRHRAARQGWRRQDAPDPEPVDLEAERAAGLPEMSDMAARALVRANRAILRGRAAEAAAWLRVHRTLSATPPPPPPEPEHAPAREPEPEPLAALGRDMEAVTALAREVARLAPDDDAGLAAIDDRITALQARAADWLDSDDSDDSDPIFVSPESEIDPPAPEPPG